MFQRHQPYENQMPLPYLYAMLCPSQRCGINNDEYDDNDPPGKIPNCHLGFCPLGFCPLGFIPTTPITGITKNNCKKNWQALKSDVLVMHGPKIKLL